jgi:hypothetical protein
MQCSCNTNEEADLFVHHCFSPIGEVLFRSAARLRLQIAAIAVEIAVA